MLSGLGLIDYLNFTVFTDDDSLIQRICVVINQPKLIDDKMGGQGYLSRFSGLDGFKLFMNPTDVEERGKHYHFRLPGSAVRLLPLDHLIELYNLLLLADKYKITRMDIAIDTQAFTDKMLIEAFLMGAFKTRVNRSNIQLIMNGDGAGMTLYVGSPTSDNRLRIYKKLIEDHPLFEDEYFMRVEFQLRDTQATHVFCHLPFMPLDNWCEWFASAINSFFKIDRDWWLVWMDGVSDNTLLQVQRPTQQLSRSARWLIEQVSATLAMYVNSLGGKDKWARIRVLDSLYDEGLQRLSARHRAVICSLENLPTIHDKFVASGMPVIELTEHDKAKGLKALWWTLLEKGQEKMLYESEVEFDRAMNERLVMFGDDSITAADLIDLGWDKEFYAIYDMAQMSVNPYELSARMITDDSHDLSVIDDLPPL